VLNFFNLAYEFHQNEGLQPPIFAFMDQHFRPIFFDNFPTAQNLDPLCPRLRCHWKQFTSTHVSIYVFFHQE